MNRKSNYLINDYVKYEGNLSTLASILRDPDIGKIIQFEVHHNIERINLFLLGKKESIWCDFQDIRPIYTEPEHLKALDFVTVDVNGKKKYILGALTISGCLISTPSTTYLLRYCLGDFSNGVQNIGKYLVDETLDLDKFFNDFPDVSNVNDLLTFLENQGRIIDKEKIVKNVQ